MSVTEYEKKSITVPHDVIDEVNALIGDGNFSAYVTDALRRQIQHDKLAQLVVELEADFEPAAPEEYQRAVRELTE